MMISTDTHSAASATTHGETRSSRSLAKMNQVLNTKLGQSGSIRNLISFYEATYSKKQRTTVQTRTSFSKAEAPKEFMKCERHISKSSCLNLPSSVSPPASPGFLPSPSSSSSSSTEKLSLSSSGSYNSDSLAKKDTAASIDKENKGMKSTSLLWSISTTSSSSGFSSGFSSPSQSEAPTPFATEENLKKSITDSSIANENKINTAMKPEPKIKASKKTHSIQNLAEQLLGKKKLSSLKLKHTSMNKLFESKKTKQLRQNNKQTSSQEQITETTTTTENQTPLERPTDLTLFKSIKKVLHTVKLCKLEKLPAAEPVPEAKNASECLNNKPIDSSLTKRDVKLNLKDSIELEPEPKPEPKLETRSTKTENFVKTATTNSITTTTYTNNNDHVQNRIKPISNNQQLNAAEKTIVKSNFTTKPLFDDSQKALSVTKNFRTNNNTKVTPTPSWSSQMSTSYSFSTSNKQPVTRSQSQKYVKTNNNYRQYDPRNAQKIVLEWCQHHTRNYHNVNIVNFSSSWSDGLAFCALIHSFLPDSFDYETLTAANRRHNFELAFETAHNKAGVMPLLEVEDMLSMGNRPDDRCVFTYVSTIFSRFQSRSTKTSAKYKENNTISTTLKNVNSTKYQKSISLID